MCSIIADRRGLARNWRRTAAAVLAPLLAAAVLVGAGATAATASTAAKAGCTRARPPVRNVAYEAIPGVAPRLTSLDVYPLAERCDAPVVVWVHGGGWQIGDKGNQIADKARLAAARGWVLVSVDYRLTDPASPAPVVYPTHNEDVAAAIAWVEDHIAEFGGDPSRIAILGHSAGAQIVASLATDERYLEKRGLSLSDVRCAGALDTEGFDVASRARSGLGSALYRAAFGDDPVVWADASPLLHVEKGKDIPSFLVVERGAAPRRAAQEQFAAALRQAGVPVTVLDAGTLTHGQVNSLIGAPGDTVMTRPLVAFLSKCFAAR